MFRYSITAAALLAVAASAASPPVGNRYAVVVGVKEYDHAKLKPLAFTENDATGLATELRKANYTVALLTDTAGAADARNAPTLTNVRKRLSTILARTKRNDTVLVALAGHGMQFDGKKDSYFCPKDANPSNARTLVSLTELYRELDNCGAGVKMLLVDACRDDPVAGTSRGVDGNTAPRPPRGVAALFSCSAGQRAFEHPKLKHGVFFHYVLAGLREPATRNDRGEVTWGRLADFVTEKVSREVPILVGNGAKQEPNQVADLSGLSPVVVNSTGTSVAAKKPTPAPSVSKVPQVDVAANAAVAAQIAAGRRHLGRREFREAIDHFTAAVTMMPDNAAGYLYRAEAFASLQDFGRSLADLNTCIRIDPKSAHYFYRAALVRHAMGDFDRALFNCEHAMKLNPAFAEAAGFRQQLLRERSAVARGLR